MLTPEQCDHIRESNRISKAIIEDTLKLTGFLQKLRPQGFQLTFTYIIDRHFVACVIKDWLRHVRRLMCTPETNLGITVALFLVPSDNMFEWLDEAVSDGHPR